MDHHHHHHQYGLSIGIIILYFFLRHPTFMVAVGSSPALYYPVDDDMAVNCGSSRNSTALDGRQWIGDTGSKYIIISQRSNAKLISSSSVDRPLSAADTTTTTVPYLTARISRSQFTYTFHVTPGLKFLRLHFCPASYPGFKSSKAFFTVKAGPHTLLSNFSALFTAEALGLKSFAKEFCVNVEQEDLPLNITFSATSSDGAYAFVNGIEIVSMPTGLYHTPEGDPGAHVVGKKYQFSIDKSIALEMVQRLNVGGGSISSVEDTGGMFREWSEDSKFLSRYSSVNPVTTTIRIKYTKIPMYIAPQKVYQTTWSVVPNHSDKQVNKTFNFTWKLPVDLGFRYLVRFHFCALEYEIEESESMEFSIFINDHIAEANANIIKWGGANGVAVYRDYVVMMEGDRTEGKRDLLITLCPHEIHNYEWRNEGTDAIVKGLEVFKLSNPDNNLASVNPLPLAYPATPSNPNRRKLVFSIGGNAIATVVVLLITILNIIVYQLRIWGEKFGEKNISSLPSEGLCRHFSLAEVQSVTNNFDDELVIGRGGFGKVYKGLIDGGTTIVAMKRLNSKSNQGANEFWTEIETLSKLRHKHLVSLIGYCNESHEMILVYEYMKHGTLSDHLYKISSNENGNINHLSWEQRLNICIGAARGLDYLHTGTPHSVIHRDVKTSNILLDKDWVARISDFGLCKIGPTSHSHTHISTSVKGTFGYLDPEYFFTRRLTKKSDVYAFGVVLLEVLCGRPAVDTRLEEEQRSLALWAQQCIKEGKLSEIIDPSLTGRISSDCLKVFVEVANKCLHHRPNGRPTMADVVVSLERVMASQDHCRDSYQDEAEEVSWTDDDLIDDNIQIDDANVQDDFWWHQVAALLGLPRPRVRKAIKLSNKRIKKSVCSDPPLQISNRHREDRSSSPEEDYSRYLKDNFVEDFEMCETGNKVRGGRNFSAWIGEELKHLASEMSSQKSQSDPEMGIFDLHGKYESTSSTVQGKRLSTEELEDLLIRRRKVVRQGQKLFPPDKEFLTKMTQKVPQSFEKEILVEILEAPLDSREMEQLDNVPEGITFLSFNRISFLRILDLSYTSINYLPESISILNALQKFILRGCELLTELPPEIGELSNLEVLDLEGIEIIYLPKEIAKLINLRCLKVLFYGSADQYQESQRIVDTIIPRGALSNLSRLNELNMDVNPDAYWWDFEVKAIINDLCSLQELRTLKLYLPTVELFEDLRWNSTSMICPALAHFRFIVGRREEHFISRLPHEVEEKFNNLEKLEKGLKYINGEGIPTTITEALKHVDAFYLERHWTAKNLSEFGLKNMDELKFCCLVECNEFRTIIDAKQFYKEGDCEEEIVLGSLQYLSIHYMKNMESICQGPVGKGCLSNLKYLALRTCISLTAIFTLGMLGNLVNLEELIVEDCPKINSLVSLEYSGLKSGHFLPSLKKISLLELPELVNISNGLHIAPKLERMVIFYCPKLVNLYTMEVSSKDLKVIKGENEWWGALKWYESDLSCDQQDYLASVFVPLRRDGDLVAQFTED